MNGGVDWVSSLIVLGVGLVVGALLVWRLLAAGRAGGPTAPTLDPELRDLVAKKDTLLQQLRELEDTAEKRDPSQLAAERYQVELATARVMMELDDGLAQARQPEPRSGEAEAAEAGQPAGALGRSPALRGFLWGAGSIVGLGLLLYFVSQSATERAPGSSPTGEVPGTASATPAPSQEESQIKAQLERNPDDVEARLALSRLYLERQDLMGVWNETQRVLELAPDEPRALSYQSLVRLAMGQPEMALEMLERALASTPELFDAHVHKALVLAQMGRLSDAEQTMQAAAQRFPDQREVVEQLWSAMREQAAAPAVSAAPPVTRAPGGEPPASPGPPRSSAPSESAQELGGTLELDPALVGQVPAGAVIYVTVRQPGGGGPPLAVSRLEATGFPLAFSVGGGHPMTEGPMPDRVLVEARVDSDGDPISRDPSDPSATLDDVQVGTMDLRLVLRR